MAIYKAINKKTDRPQTMRDLKRIIDYIYRTDKTREELMDGKECISKTAYDDFELLKKTHNKMDGRLYIHSSISFHKDDNVTYDQVKEFADKFLKHPKFENFQIAYSVHTDKPEKHFHFVINSVGLDGVKWRISKWELQKLHYFMDELCREYGTSVVERKGIMDDVKTMAECKLIEKNSSWKEEMKEAIMFAAENSVNRLEFINKLKALGYEVKWTKERQRILFTSAEGNSCSDTKLGTAYGKTELNKMFKDNYQNKDKDEMESKFKEGVVFINEFEKELNRILEEKKEHTEILEVEGYETKNHEIEILENKVFENEIIENVENEQSDKREKEFFEKVAELKNEHAIYQLAMMIIKSECPVKEELDNALNTLKELADNGNNNAQYNYGRLLLSGETLTKNSSEAIRYFEMAAEQKNSFALYKLGTIYLDEELGIKNISKSLEYLTQVANLKNSGAFYKLGSLYLEGKDTEIDTNRAVEYLNKAINLENDMAMYKLGTLYLSGEIVEKNIPEGINLLELAIEKENHIAMCKMASLKIEAEVIEKDVDGAVELYKKAVDKKSDNAMYQLGKLYFLGKEVKQDKEEALKYLDMAVKAGNEYAQNFLDYQDWILFNQKLDVAVDILMIIENRSGGGNDRIRPLTEKSKEEKRAYVKEMSKGGVTYIEHMHEL